MKSPRLKGLFVLTVGLVVYWGASASPLLLAATSVPATILTQPEDQTAIELLPVTFTVKAIGDPLPRLQWFRNDVSIARATNSTYSFFSVLADDGAVFRVEARNTSGGLPRVDISSNAVLHVTADRQGPLLVKGTTLSMNVVQLEFSEGIWPDSASNLASYSITSPSGDLSVANVTVDGRRILLGTTTATLGALYTATVSDVQDLAQGHNTIAPRTQITFRAVEFNAGDVGDPALPGSTTPVPKGFDLAATGGDIGGKSDQFQFNYQLRTGDFDVQVRVESLSLSDAWAKAGLMARQDRTTNTLYAAALATPSVSGCFFQSRGATNGSTTTAGSFPVNYPQTWLRLKRSGNLFTGFAGYDGKTWLQLGSVTLNIPSAIYVGLALSSRNPEQATQGKFRDFAEVLDGVTVSSLILPVEPLGPSSRKTGLVISEIMYHPNATPGASNGLEFVELYNSNPFFEDISGFRISGDIDFIFPPNTVMQGGAFLVVAKHPEAIREAYGLQTVLGPYGNSLQNSGVVRVRNQVGAIYLEVPYTDKNPWPIGAKGTGHSIVLARPSHGEGFPQAWAISDTVGGSPGRMDGYRSHPLRNVVINELLAHTEDPSLSDYIELYNHSNQPVDISGCILTDDAVTNRFVIPAKTILPARGFASFDESQLGFSLKAAGETLYFKSADLTRVLDAVDFEAQAREVSFGRSRDGASEFYPLEQRTPGAANANILIQDIVINELMYKPISGDDNDEYLELYNQGTRSVDLSGWRFTSGISFTFPSNVVMAPSAYLVIAKSAANLLAHYPTLSVDKAIGNYGGTLGNRGERVKLSRPEQLVKAGASGTLTTNLIYVGVDEVTYGTGGRWGNWANEGGSSLELIDPRSNHRLPSNWADSDETQKAPWTVIEGLGFLDNGSGVANRLEIGLLGEGECLLDDVEVMQAGSTNVVANSTFEKGLGNWVPQGNHVRSTIENSEGYNSQKSLHIRASSRGDTGANRVRVALTRTLTQNQNGVIRAKARWLRGWPEIVLRLSGNFLEATGKFTIPQNLGTPGARNSQAAANAGPAIYEVAHHPILPAANEPVIVTARAHDPDGLSAVRLNYRLDPGTTTVPVTMVDDGTGGDAVAGDGLFSGTIPGQPANAMVAFHVQASDNALTPATNTFPNPAPARECLVRFGDPVPTGAFGTYRQWYTQSAVNSWVNRPALSNERVEGTFVYNNFRVIHGMSAKYAGSPYHQGFNSPVTAGCHYSIELPLDDLLLGTENFNKVHAPGNGPFDDDTAQREQTCYWFARQMDVPWNYRRFVNMYVNGNRKGGTTTMMEDTQTPGTDVIESLFPNDTEGHLFKLQPWFEFDDVSVTAGTGAGFQNVSWCTLNDYTTTGGEKKLARFRWNYLTRAAHGTANDYGKLYQLIDAADTPVSATYAANIDSLIDVEEWMRIFAVVHAAGDWDHYGSQNSQNMYAYKPQNGKWQLMIWDMNIVLGNSGSWGPGENLFLVSGTGANMDKMIKYPLFRRAYLRALKELATGPMSTENVGPIVDAKYAAMVISGVTPAAPTAIKTWMSTARGSILTQVASEDSKTFALTGTNDFTSDAALITLTGVAPVEIKGLAVNGADYPVTWSNSKTWIIRLVASPGRNSFTVAGYDRLGKPIEGATTSVTVNYTGAMPNPENVIVISEIMYNPVMPGASFIEIYNTSANASFDLSDWRLRGVDFTFPLGTVLTKGQSMVVCQDSFIFANTYNPAISVAGQWQGQLDPTGETLALVRPGASAGEEMVVNRVHFEARQPWPQAPNGRGASLQLADAAQDNSRVSNWHGSEKKTWQHYSYTGTVGATRLSLQTDAGGGDVYLDDLVLVAGSVAETGENLIVNGDFESGLLAPWTKYTLATNSEVSGAYAHTGGNSLHVVFARGANSLTNLFQDILPVTAGAPYTMSFWYLPGDSGTNLNARMGSAFKPSVSIGSILATPGTNNTSTAILPPYPPVWLNEVQPGNGSLLADNRGELEPWIELYNAGPGTSSLEGLYLVDNYSNLDPWAFPPGSSLAPGQFKIVFADGQPAQSTTAEWHTSFRLPPATGSVALARLVGGEPQILDYLNYSGLAAGESYGSYPDGQPFERAVFHFPSPGNTNNPALAPQRVFINEWLASNTNGLVDPAETSPKYDDWFELYNPGADPVDLAGYYLTDNLNDKRQFEIPTGYTIGPKGHLLVWADNEAFQNSIERADLHVNFQLSKNGEQIGLFAPDGTAMDTVRFDAQTNNVSQGRWPDGAPALYFMPEPTPRTANSIPGQANTHPVLLPIGNRVFPEMHLLSFKALALDADQPPQHLVFSLAAGAPAGASIAPDGQFRWRPLESQGPGVYSLTVRVTDDGTPPLSAEQTIQVAVEEVNSGPYFVDTRPKYVKAGSLLTFPTAVDGDLPPQTLAFSLGAGAPAGVSVHLVTGLFSWTPADNLAPGLYFATVQATDNGRPPISASHTYSIEVKDKADNLIVVDAVRTGASVQLTWPATAGKTYQLLYKESLAQPNWKFRADNLQTLSSTLSFTDAPPGTRFYKVRQVD